MVILGEKIKSRGKWEVKLLPGLQVSKCLHNKYDLLFLIFHAAAQTQHETDSKCSTTELNLQFLFITFQNII